MTNLHMLLKVLYNDCDRNGDKNVCEILIFRLPTVCKLLSFLNTGRDSVGGGRGGGGTTARSESSLCQYEYVRGTLGFYLYILNIFILNTS
jgi:hypothetical protein